MNRGMGHGRDPGTPEARAIRTTAVRWFTMLSVPWVVLATALAVRFGHGLPMVLGAAVVGVASVVLFGTVGLRRVLGEVERLDMERHGLREAYDRARLDSLNDGLTGLGNHRAFQEELNRLVTVARDQRRSFVLLYLDVDDLKRTNDRHGHAAGDELLKATARIVAGSMRRGDRGFRIGGDEFALLFMDCGPDQGLTIGRRILSATLDGASGTSGTAPFSVTIGVSAYPALATDRQQLVHQADAALYWGKRHGRTDVQLFDPERHGMAEDARPLEELAAAVSAVAAGRHLSPVYQPIYDLRTGRVLGYEGLVRPRPGSGFANAGALFVAAETTGRTVELDLASLETVLAGSRGLDERCYLSVNLSPRSLEAGAFSPSELLSLARRHGIQPDRLVVELTEREAVEDLVRLRAAMESLRRHGARMAADDVGSGNAGLRLLSELSFDIIKIDLSLVQAGADHEPADAVMRALRDLALRRGQTILAEGVETPAQLDAVLGLGFDAAQGYLLGRPVPAMAAGTLDLAALAGHPRSSPLPVAAPA
jgi:diguanylate cyclase (GGDEF)-like protein